ncbi:MAG TPA: cell division protein ZipA [Gammaproteobacteria bacterium]|nr:cell division protein ZipA [Gammaproteobacteria bacterium]
MNFILLFALIGLVIIGVVRALKQSPPEKRRRQQEPFLSNDPIEAVAVPPKSTATAKNTSAIKNTSHPYNAEYSVEQKHNINPPESEPEPLDSHLDHPQSQEPEPAPPALKMTDLIIINLVAEPHQPYRGYELLQALLTSGLRYSKKGLFHRYEDPTGRGNILFNLVSSIEPGTFDLPKMGSFATTGLTLFMQIPTVQNPTQVFDLMLSTANELAEDLGGQLLDEQRQPLTDEKIAKWRTYL